jgi:DNA-binding MarR family transcriptional regulator
MDNDKRDLLELLFRLVGLLRRRTMQDHRNRSPLGSPHQGQGRVLALLKLKPEVSQKELSTILDIRSQSLGELLAKLERQGYITRSPSADDHRIMDIRLTEEGRAASEQQAETTDSDSFFECLNDEEQATFGGYLERLTKKLEEELAANGMNPDFPGPDFRGRGFGNPFRRGDEHPADGPRGSGRYPDRGPGRPVPDRE